MNYHTEIDTVGLQVDCYDHYEQHKVFDQLLSFIADLGLFVKRKETIVGAVPRREYVVYRNNRTLVTIYSGSYGSKGEVRFYVTIKFAGLKTYDTFLDVTSHQYLLQVAAFLNTNNIRFKLSELDIAIDAECSFDHIMALCVKRSPKTEYHVLTERQLFRTTTYIEKIPKNRENKSVLRAYTYDKAYKEKLHTPLTRFELKLQPKFFNKYGFSLVAIEKALDRYYVMHFHHLDEKYYVMQQISGYKSVRKRECQQLGLDRYRLYPDMGVVERFINKLLYVVDLKFTK
jgi:hypothetical protein